MNKGNGIGFLSVLALIFIGLKLAEVGTVADWSWWAVLSPLWVPVALIVVLAVVVGAVDVYREGKR